MNKCSHVLEAVSAALCHLLCYFRFETHGEWDHCTESVRMTEPAFHSQAPKHSLTVLIGFKPSFKWPVLRKSTHHPALFEVGIKIYSHFWCAKYFLILFIVELISRFRWKRHVKLQPCVLVPEWVYTSLSMLYHTENCQQSVTKIQLFCSDLLYVDIRIFLMEMSVP